MSLSFWIFLIVSLVSMVPCFLDHGETWRSYKNEQFITDPKRGKILLKLILLWGIPALFLIATVISCFESAESDKEIGELKEKNEALEVKVKPRRISFQQRTNFVALTKYIPKIPIKILIGQEGKDTEELGNDLRETLTMAGFPHNADAGGWGINRDPTLLVSQHLENTNDSDLIMFSHLPDGETNHILTTMMWQATNSPFQIPINVATNQDSVYGALIHCFDQIGIKSEWNRAREQVGTNECLIFIRVK